MEITMFERFCAAQNIKAVMVGNVVPDALESLQKLFARVFMNNDSRGTLLNDIWAADVNEVIQYRNHSQSSFLKDDILRLVQECLYRFHRNFGGVGDPGRPLLHNRALMQTTINCRGMNFSSEATSVGDSQVIFGDYPSGAWFAGKISQIFLLEGSAGVQVNQVPFFLVRVFQNLSTEDTSVDHYRPYTGVGGQLFYAEYQADPIVLHFDEIVAHFACTAYRSDLIDRPCIHVLPLDR